MGRSSSSEPGPSKVSKITSFFKRKGKAVLRDNVNAFSNVSSYASETHIRRPLTPESENSGPESSTVYVSIILYTYNYVDFCKGMCLLS